MRRTGVGGAGRDEPSAGPSAGPSAESFAAALARGPLVLDGGLSNELEAQGCDMSDALWTARLLRDAPARIEAAHAAYVRAGAQVVTTAGYQASFEGFARAGADRREAAELFRRGVALARAAARTSPGPGRVWVAASVGPYGAVQADGGEYRGRYGLSVRELVRFHRPRIEASAEAEPDVLALETVPDADEAEALLQAAEGCGLPVWLSYTVSGDRTAAGQPLDAAFALTRGNGQVAAVGVNCCDTADAARAVPLAAETAGKPVVVYPNSGEQWDAAARGWHAPATWSAARVAGLTAHGARLLGGCCRVGPPQIAGLARLLAG